MISTGGADLVYRSVEEIPRGLRTRLLKSTSGGNSGIILIADRRGRKEIAKVVGKLPGGRKRAEWLTSGQKRAMAAVLALGARAVVYVACDPAALGRDVGHLRAAGWRLERVQGYDLFPMTQHVEAVALLLPPR